VSVSATVVANRLSWSLAGDHSTVHHYTVFVSSDGQNLMPLADLPAGTRSLDLSQFSFNPGNYALYVKAIGQPSISNKMSPAATFAVSDTLALPREMFRVQVAPASATVQSGQSASFAFTVTPDSGTNLGPTTFSCSNLPFFATCGFSPATLAPGQSAATTTLTVAIAALSSAHQQAPLPPLRYSAATAMFALPAIVLIGARGKRRKLGRVGTLGLLALLAAWQLGCGGGNKIAVSPPTAAQSAARSGSYTITVIASAGSVQQSATITVNVR